MPTLITVRGIRDKKYDASEFTKLPIFFESLEGTITLINREFYIVDNLSAKVLITIDILKPERIVINFRDNLIKTGSY